MRLRRKSPSQQRAAGVAPDKFEAERLRQEKKAADDHYAQQQAIHAQRMAARAEHLATMAANRQFMQQWD